MEEHQLITAIGLGDKQAFSTLYKVYSSKVYNIAISYTKNPEDAEEVTQDVFVKIFMNASSFKGASTLSTWIYRISINTSLNYLKKKKRIGSDHSEVRSDMAIDFDHPGVLLENKENAATLYRVMEYLPDTQKTAFILSYIEYLPRQEVADIMETTLKAVESLLQRAKKRMRIELEMSFPDRRKFNN